MLYKEFEELFPSELSAIEYFIKIRYPDGVICPHCGGRQLIYRR
ncbi:MAG: transposase, partial [Methanocalculaceae archaeon]|nr:transposase [Methanocalculaceae archaeon]